MLQVDGLCEFAQTWLWPKAALSEVQEQHEQTARDYSEARTAYLDRIEEALDFLRAQGVSGTAKYALSAVMGRLDEAQHISLDNEAEVVVQRVSDAWASLASLQPGAPVLPACTMADCDSSVRHLHSSWAMGYVPFPDFMHKAEHLITLPISTGHSWHFSITHAWMGCAWVQDATSLDSSLTVCG